jgi:hypothetical protein
MHSTPGCGSGPGQQLITAVVVCSSGRRAIVSFSPFLYKNCWWLRKHAQKTCWTLLGHDFIEYIRAPYVTVRHSWISRAIRVYGTANTEEFFFFSFSFREAAAPRRQWQMGVDNLHDVCHTPRRERANAVRIAGGMEMMPLCTTWEKGPRIKTRKTVYIHSVYNRNMGRWKKILLLVIVFFFSVFLTVPICGCWVGLRTSRQGEQVRESAWGLHSM